MVICWNKRIWCCPHAACPVKTWTEVHPAIAPRACLTEWARAWAFEQVGQCDAAVSRVAAELGVAWWTIMSLTIQRGISIIEDLGRLGDDVEAVGGRRDIISACHEHASELVCHRDHRPDPRSPGQAARHQARPLGHGAGRLAGCPTARLAGSNCHRVAGPLPWLCHRAGHPAAPRHNEQALLAAARGALDAGRLKMFHPIPGELISTGGWRAFRASATAPDPWATAAAPRPPAPAGAQP